MMFAEIMLLPLSCIGLLIVLAQAIRLRRIDAVVQQQGNLLAMIKQEMEALLLCEKGMGNRIKQQQQQVRSIIERQDKLEINDGSNTSYKQAMVLLQKGASTDELIDACELSRGELELLSKMKIASNSNTTSRVA